MDHSLKVSPIKEFLCFFDSIKKGGVRDIISKNNNPYGTDLAEVRFESSRSPMLNVTEMSPFMAV